VAPAGGNEEATQVVDHDMLALCDGDVVVPPRGKAPRLEEPLSCGTEVRILGDSGGYLWGFAAEAVGSGSGGEDSWEVVVRGGDGRPVLKEFPTRRLRRLDPGEKEVLEGTASSSRGEGG